MVTLDELLDQARLKWPDVRVEEADFVAYVEARVPAGGSAADVQTGDLYLACACTRGDKTALIHVYRILERAVGSAFAGMPLAGLDPLDVTQRLCERLLFENAEGGTRLAEYSGRAPLRAWLRVIAVRELLQLRRKQRRETGASMAGDDEGLARWVANDAPELEGVKAGYRKQVQEMLARALDQLTPRQRNLLRQHYQFGLTLDHLASLYGVHRATAARWLAEAREMVLEVTRKSLETELGADQAEVESIIRMVISQLELHMSATLTRTR